MSGEKRKERTPTWSVVFEDASALRAVVDSVATVMSRVNFKVARKEDGKYFLEVDSADMGFMCCVSARLLLDKVEFPGGEPEEEFTFCLDCKHVSSAIDNPSCAHLALIMEGFNNESKLRLTMMEPDSHTYEACSEVPLYNEDEPVSLQDLDFDMLLELDLPLLREMIKKARKAHTEHLKVRVYLEERGTRRLSMVVFTVDGDFLHEQRFCHETARDDDGSTVVRAAQDGTHRLLDTDALSPAFEASFPAEKIEAFVKNLSCRMLVGKVKNGMPLMLTYPLGGANDDRSRILFLVAPVHED